MEMNSVTLWVILLFNFTFFLIYGFGRISRGNSKTVIEFTGGILILLSIAVMFILNGVVSGVALVALSLLIVAPLTGFIMAGLEKKLYRPKQSAIFHKKCGLQVPYNYDNLTFYYCLKDKLGWNFEDINENKKYNCKACGEVLRRFVVATFHSTCPICEQGQLDINDKNTKLYHALYVMTDKQKQEHLKGLYGVVDELQSQKQNLKHSRKKYNYNLIENFKKNLAEDEQRRKKSQLSAVNG